MFEKSNRILEGALLALCLLSSTGAIVYRLYRLDAAGVLASLVLSLIGYIIILRIDRKFNKRSRQTNTFTGQDKKQILPIIAYLGLVIFLFYLLIIKATASALVSPWQVVPAYFFLLYFLATLILFAILLNSKKPSTYLISIHYFLSFSVAAIIYRIGYGFDPFVHNASMDVIDNLGEIEPKPFYYLGYYSAAVIIHKLSFIPISIINTYLVPFLASIYLPATLWKAMAQYFDNKTSVKLTLLTLLILPFGYLISTTPQNFAYLLLLIVIIRGLTCGNYYDLAVLYLISITALLTQPIAGIPALGFTIILTLYFSDIKRAKKYLFPLFYAGLAFALPAAFYVFEKFNYASSGSGQASEAPGPLPLLFSIDIPRQENVLLNYAYLYGSNIGLIILLVAIPALYLSFKHKKECKIFALYLLASCSLFVSYIITTFLPFSFLVSYERSDYAERMLVVAVFFLLPFFILALFSFLNKLQQQSLPLKIIFLSLLALVVSSSFYMSYPRFDNYHNSRGYSVGQNDINAVRWIEENSEKDFIVLANQQTSAAALNEFGFKKYYGNNIFYYPIPTGGKLYNHYLEMVYDSPKKVTAIKAMDLAGVDLAYFVLNKYWWAYPKLLKEARLEADEWREFDNGEVVVFKYKR